MHAPGMTHALRMIEVMNVNEINSERARAEIARMETLRPSANHAETRDSQMQVDAVSRGLVVTVTRAREDQLCGVSPPGGVKRFVSV
jgi:hypothetical protein